MKTLPEKNAPVRFDATREDVKLIDSIVQRAITEYAAFDRELMPDYMTLSMDLTATHLNGCPLDLPRMLAAPTTDFLHDIAGIRRHINRRTGTLDGCFLPRMARREVSA